ncbi:hypothetical protein ACGRHY_27110 [Streptomyces sp. HK10]|uniref:hypothetical protein n=1 Tax=Streptomyces sp. HK10 TaxID=3373255 RepID=UPI0037481A17
MEPKLPETLQRLNARTSEQGLEPLNARQLSERTALPEEVVEALLKGDSAPPDTVEARVCTRIVRLANDYMTRTGSRLVDLISAVVRHFAQQGIDISEMWARQLLTGKKVPNVAYLHGLGQFFQVEGGEQFFTASAPAALNRVLLVELRRLEGSEAQDPMEALMKRYGVVGTDFRLHGHGPLNAEQLDRILAGVFRSIFPTSEDGQ